MKRLVVFLAVLSVAMSAHCAEKRKGRVLSPRGLPLSDAKVQIRYGAIVHTDKSGEFSFEGLPGLIEATHTDWPEHKAIATPYLEQEDYLLLILRKTLTLAGRIQTRSSTPIPNARIFAEIYAGAYSASGFAKVQSVTSRDDGSYLIAELVPGNRYRLIVYAKGYSRLISDLFYVSGHYLSINGIRGFHESIIMYPGRTVTFTVLLPDGKPVPKAVVRVGGKDWEYGRGHTDSKGKVSIDDLPNSALLEKRSRKGQLHVVVACPNPWKQDGYYYRPDSDNNIVIQLAGSGSAPKSLRIKNDLQMTISIPKQEFRVQEPILVDCQMRNIGKDPKTLCLKRDRNTVFWQFGIRSKEYDLFPAPTRMAEIRTGLPAVTEDDFITLPPGEAYQCKLNLLDYVYKEDVFRKQGPHKLYVTYENHFDGKELGFDAWRCGHGLGPESNYISFTIR